MPRLPPFSALFSPPESLLHDFEPPSKKVRLESQDQNERSLVEESEQTMSLKRALQPISPPVSPQIKLHRNTEGSAGLPGTHGAVSDPVLFENSQRTETSSAALFQPSVEEAAEQAINEHISKRDSVHAAGRHALPTRSEYAVFLKGISHVWSTHNSNPHAYLRAVKSDNNAYRALAKGPQATMLVSSTLRPAKTLASHKSPKIPKMATGDRVKKVFVPKRVQVHRQTPLASPKAARKPDGDEKALPRKKIEDVDFMALPDLSPPLSTLDDGRPLKVDWQATALDLSQDSNRHLLHPTELALASALRLSCATYLCSKRRIFVGRINCIREGREFRKTDAQQACKIDVNKASRLWTAYDRFGWFDRQYFTAHV